MTTIKQGEDEDFDLLGHHLDIEAPRNKNYGEPKSHVDNRQRECIEKLLPCIEARKDGHELTQDESNIYHITKSKTASKYDPQNHTHESYLKQLYREFVHPKDPPADPVTLQTSAWTLLGFQNSDPRSDFRGGGVNALVQLLTFCRLHGEKAQAMVEETAKGTFLLACNSIGCSYWLQNYFHFSPTADPRKELYPRASRRSFKLFCSLLVNDKHAFETLYLQLFTKVFDVWVAALQKDPQLTIIDFGSADRQVKAAFVQLFDDLRVDSLEDVKSHLDRLCADLQGIHKFTF